MMKNVTFNAKGFIIPNPAGKVSEFKAASSYSGGYEYLIEMAKLNGIQLELDDQIVQVWLHSKELECDNIQDHGFFTKIDGIEVMVSAYKSQWIPLKLIADIKEGESKMLVMPAIAYPDRKGFIRKRDGNNIILNINITFQQKGYRYKRFGNFEDVVKLVCIKK